MVTLLIFFDKSLEKFRIKVANSRTLCDNDSSVDNDLNQNALSEETDNKWKFIFKIPYLGETSYDFQKTMITLFKTKFCVDVVPVFTSFKVSSYFSLKSRVPTQVKPNVVYRFKCLRDADVEYIGKTERHLVTRVSEHLRKKGKTHISKHLSECPNCNNGNLTVKNFEVIKSAKNGLELGIF